MKERKQSIASTFFVIMLFINFAGWIRVYAAEDELECEFRSYTSDPCDTFDEPVRHIPDDLLKAPDENLDFWFDFGEDMVDWFGIPGDADNFMQALKKAYFWRGVYLTGATLVLMGIVGVVVEVIERRLKAQSGGFGPGDPMGPPPPPPSY